MRKITQDAVSAFVNSEKLKKGNTEVRIMECRTNPKIWGIEKRLYLNGHLIAVFNTWSGLTIQMSGKFYSSYLESLERLNGFEDVDIKVEKGTLCLNGKEWDGKRAQITKGFDDSAYPQHWSTEDGFGKVNMNR